MSDILLVNGTILTLDGMNSTHSAVAMRDGRIHAVGPVEELRRAASPEATVVDLAGQTVCPGFIDGHNHFSIASFEPRQIDCSTPPLASVPEVLDTIRRRVASEPPGQWVRAWGFHSSKVPEQRNPTRWELDEVCPDNPLVLMDASYHACHVNSKSLAMAGITKHSPNPKSGEIVKDDRGEPTGTLLESAMDIPQSLSWLSFIHRSPEDAIALVEQNCRRHLAVGITGVGDALVLPEAADLYRRVAEAGRLLLTVHQMHGGATFFAAPRLDRVGGGDMVSDFGRMLRGGTLKMFMDTVYPSPAIDRCEHGIPDYHVGNNYYSQREAEELVVAATARQLDVSIHCLGNCAVQQALDTFATVRKTGPGRDARLRIEHFILGDKEQVTRTAELGAIVMTQPIFAHTWGDVFHTWRGDGQPQLRILPLRSLLDAGVVVAASSDYPCDALPPVRGIWSAVVRRALNGDPVDPDEAVTPLEALRMYTSAAAIACGRAAEEGAIEVGKRANVVVLDRNPLTCSPESLRDIVVTQTYVDGNRVFDRATVGNEATLATPTLH